MIQITEKNMGELVRYHRKKRRLTQQQLAALAGVGKTMVFDLEKGKKTVKMNSLFRVLGALEIRLLCDCIQNDAGPADREMHQSAS